MSQTKAQLIAGTPTQDVTFNDATVNSLNGGPLAGTRNRIINGDMRIAQRGTSFAAITAGTYSLDRWRWNQNGAMVCTISQDSDVPNNTFQNSLKVDVTTADTSIGAGDFVFVRQNIEGFNVRDLIGTTFTLSFWVKSPKTGVHCVGFGNSFTDRVYIKEYTIISANTWEYKSVTVSGGLITSGTWDWTNGSGLEVSFTLAAGTALQTTADAWQTGSFHATANQVNVMDSTANNFYLTGVQLEVGSVATPFERRSYGDELARCQRYYEIGEYSASGITHYANGDTRSSITTFATTKRVIPTVTFNTTAISIFAVGSNGSGVNLSGSIASVQANTNAFRMNNMGNYAAISGVVGGGDYSWGLSNNQIFYANAEL